MIRSPALMLLAAALALSAPGLARAQAAAKDGSDTVPTWAVGINLMSCKAWVANRPASGQIEPLQRIAPMDWLYGYMAGKSSVLKLNLMADLHPSAVGEWLDVYCQAHPQDDIQQAAVVLAGDLTSVAAKR